MQLGFKQYWGESAQQWDFDGLTVSLTKYPPLQQQTRHRHENPTYFFLVKGAFIDESTELGSRSPEQFELLFHPAGAWHEGKSGPNGRLGLNIEPSQAWLDQFDLSFNDLGGYRIESDPIRSSELLRLATTGFDGETSGDQILEMLVPTQSVSLESPAWFRKLCARIHSPNSESLNLRSLAEEMAVHPVYLSRVFRATYGQSVSEWLRRKRLMTSAKSLLAGQPISEIAYETGFADHSHFGRVFRSQFRVSPREFRQHWGQ